MPRDKSQAAGTEVGGPGNISAGLGQHRPIGETGPPEHDGDGTAVRPAPPTLEVTPANDSMREAASQAVQTQWQRHYGAAGTAIRRFGAGLGRA